MKFINGYWLLKEGIDPVYAVEYYSHEISGDELRIYVAANHISGRGDILNRPMLTVTLTSPMPGIAGVSAVHFEGSCQRGPFFYKNAPGAKVSIREEEDRLIYITGNLEVTVDKRPESFSLRFTENGKLLTESSFRNLAYMIDRNTDRRFFTEQLLLDVGECIYGLGERFTPFVKNGQVVECWNEDGGTASWQAYKNVPFYLSNKGYGVFVDDPGDVSFEIGSEKVSRTGFCVEGERLDYYVIAGGSMKGSLSMYTALTGRPALPPAWTFGLWLTTSFTTDYDEATVTSFIDGMKDRAIPLHTFHFDCFWMKGYEWVNFTWDPDVFPDPPGMIRRLHERGLHVCVWINSYVAQKSILFQEGAEKGYFVRKTDGSVWQTDLWQAGMALVDFTNPEAEKWYEDKLEALIDMGVDCFKTDFGERIPVTGICWHDGSDPVKMHNYYTFLYNRCVFRLLERKLGHKQAAVFARSATAGSQMFPVHWGGDCSASFSSMAETLRGGLSLAMSGFGFWSHDIGGFEQTASADVYKRWCAFGLLSSHSRLHGSSTYRVPWNFDEEACDVLRFFVRLKCSLMPYLYGAAVCAHREGIPMLRPMALEFPEDPACEYLDRQYMLGDSLLVAPVMREDGEVSYYLPAGRWTHLLSRNMRTGGKWYKEKYDYFSLPLFVREGAILPIGADEERPDYDYLAGTTVKIFELSPGSESEVWIPSCDGGTLVKVRAERKGDQITVWNGGIRDLRTEICIRDAKCSVTAEAGPDCR